MLGGATETVYLQTGRCVLSNPADVSRGVCGGFSVKRDTSLEVLHCTGDEVGRDRKACLEHQRPAGVKY